MKNSSYQIYIKFLIASSTITVAQIITAQTLPRLDTVGGVVGSIVGAATADVSDVALAAFKSDFDLLKVLGLASIAIGVLVGLVFYAYRHKRLMQYDAVLGLALTLVVAPILFFLFTQVLSSESRACFSAVVVAGADSLPFDAACSSAREGAANMIGLKSIWRMVMGESIVNGLVVPLAADSVKFLMYLSVIFGSALLYLVILPLLKKFA